MSSLGFGILDYLFWAPIIIFSLVGLFKNDDRAIVHIIVYLIFLSPIVYYFHMPSGYYKARFIEINNMKVGEGTEDSKEFEVLVNDNSFMIRDPRYFTSTYIIPSTAKWNSNLYVKTFEQIYGDKFLTITRFGYVSIHEKDGSISAKLKVSY